MPVIQTPEKHTHERPNTRFTTLAAPSRGTRETSLWRVQIQPNTAAPAHELTREELFYVLAGQARIELAGEQHRVRAGDVIVVPADTLFALHNDSDEELEMLCCLPVGAQAKLDGQVFTPPWAE
ncbi:cupin domain-containing protein [Haliangium ochraceum]|uniref:Cupin 2 conserved barrel domain protein n=1 Tax=Haliangium ochraceum (strain DSM 14365 / JCM 11303 / SMP-2) TaxID=502025 RepID=D0LHD5_HALO1|nr:cupin domain-containing protein [Haliangium ochraceum]ACY18280.1 Cupin 2 conserved barrel domain protein [Haliangium ochraceum DSM 14365]